MDTSDTPASRRVEKFAIGDTVHGDALPAPPPRFVSIVLPVHNQQQALPALHAAVTAAMAKLKNDYEVIFVDDGSTDGSFPVLVRLHNTDPHVRVVQLRRAVGSAMAQTAGFRQARGQILVTLDCRHDDPQDIPSFVDHVSQGYDVVIGWRELTSLRRLGNSLGAALSGVHLRDLNCSFRAYRREVADELDIYGELRRYGPVLAVARGFTFTELVLVGAATGSGLPDLEALLDFLGVVFVARTARRPLRALGVGGLALGTIGMVAALVLLLGLLVPGVGGALAELPAAFPVLLVLAVVGAQFFAVGLLGEVLLSLRGSQACDASYSVRRLLGAEQAGKGRPAD